MKFSIVTISYNQGRFLEQAIRSVLEQDYGDLEYIVVDPGSTDGSREIIEKYRDRIAAAVLEPDRGPADGLNKGFARATGEICGYLNADDYFEPDAFKRVARFFGTRPAVDVLCGAIRIIRHNGKARPRAEIADRFDLKRFVAGVCTVGQQGTFFRRRAFALTRGFSLDNRTCWDAELLVDLALARCRFAVMHKVLGNFRLHAESISGSGRLNGLYLQDLERIRNRLAAANIRVHPARAAVMRLAHKADVMRHLRALAVR
jgi:glycosyltransferase involved in cell wall biosynthesis